MLYRYYDCGIFDSDREPSTTLWVEAMSPAQADANATAILAAAWNVPKERVCIQSRTSELDALADAVEGTEAGDRRLWATGSWGERPTYFRQAVIVAVGHAARTRLQEAFRAAQAHARELATSVAAEAEESRRAGNMRHAEHCDYEVEKYREFALADLI